VAKKKFYQYTEDGRLAVPLTFEGLACAEHIVAFLSEWLKKNPNSPPPKTKEACREAIKERLFEMTRAAKYDLTDEEEKALKEPAEKIARGLFPELFAHQEPGMFLRPDPDGPEQAAGAALRVHCPVCGKAGQTTGSPSDDGTTYSIPMEGDCGHRWTLCVRTERGQTHVYPLQPQSAAPERTA
jgi:hypothetical protein